MLSEAVAMTSEYSIEEAKKVLSEIEKILENKKNCVFLAGKNPTIADYVIFSQISDLQIYDLEEE